MHQTVYIRFNEGEFLESSTSLFSGVLTYEVDDNSTHYRWNNRIIINKLNFSLFDWKFNHEISVKESCNFNDEYQIRFWIKSVSPIGKCEETEFSGNYLFSNNDNRKSAVECITTAIYLIASTGNPKWAKEIYEHVLTYPLLSHYPKAFTNIYVTALMLLLNSSYMVGCINTSTSMSKEFRNYVVRMYNYMLEDFSNNISKYHSENRIEESV